MGDLEDLQNKLAQELQITALSKLEEAVVKVRYSFKELWEDKDKIQQFLITDLIPSEAVATLIGEDGIGKTQLLSELCLCICLGRAEFLSLPIIIKHGAALVVATEDSKQKFTAAIMKQIRMMEMDINPDKIRLNFIEASNIDEYDSLFKEMDDALTAQPCDLVVVDALSDLFTLIDGEINSNSHARRILSRLQQVAEKHHTAIVVVHHAAKTKVLAKRDKGKIFLEKNDSQGAGAISQKPRTVLALSSDPKTLNEDGNEYTNYLHVVKANLMGKQFFNNALELKFSTGTLLHTFKGMVDIKMMEETDQADPVNAASARKKPKATDIKAEQHIANVIHAFAEDHVLQRADLITRMGLAYGCGVNKITEKGGYLDHCLSSGWLMSINGTYKRMGLAAIEPPIADASPF